MDKKKFLQKTIFVKLLSRIRSVKLLSKCLSDVPLSGLWEKRGGKNYLTSELKSNTRFWGRWNLALIYKINTEFFVLLFRRTAFGTHHLTFFKQKSVSIDQRLFCQFRFCSFWFSLVYSDGNPYSRFSLVLALPLRTVWSIETRFLSLVLYVEGFVVQSIPRNGLLKRSLF